MAIFDVVADEVANATNYQPASGVEVSINNLTTSSSFWGIYDGTTSVNLFDPSYTTTTQIINGKIRITNSIYLRSGTGTTGNFYGGVQVG